MTSKQESALNRRKRAAFELWKLLGARRDLGFDLTEDVALLAHARINSQICYHYAEFGEAMFDVDAFLMSDEGKETIKIGLAEKAQRHNKIEPAGDGPQQLGLFDGDKLG